MYSPHKHSYLQSRTDGINPRIINRSVQRARDQICIDEHDLDPPFLRLTSEQPCIPIENVDVTRRPVAFGRWAMPKLRRELHDKDPLVVSQAVNSICDLVHDPERGYEAIKLRIPDRMVDLIVSEDPTIRERTCMALTTMAGLLDGKLAIVKNQYMLANIAMAIEDDINYVRMKAATLLEIISRSWMAADELVDFGFIQILLENIISEEHPITTIHLESLKFMMYCEGKCIALENNGFDKFVALIERNDTAIQAGAINCLMILTTSKIGKRLAFKSDILPRLNALLHDERPEIYTAAAAAIMFCTIKSIAKLRAREMKHMPERLITLAKSWHEPSVQIYAIKALTNICEHPLIRKEVYKNYLDDLEGIIVGSVSELKEYKEILLSIVNWVPHYG